MARKIRLEFAGACYHVINRGNYRRDLFTGEGAAESFQRCLFEACGAFTWRLHAFVIMRNHFHLAVETPEPNLSEGMKWLQGTWAMRFNRYRGETGRPFQGRYKALHVEPGYALAQVAHYIHLNPVRAGVVTSENLLKYPHSSLPCFAAPKRSAILEGSTVLRESGGLPDTRRGWHRYLEYLGVMAEEERRLREKKFGRLSRGWVVGSREFKSGLKKELAERVGAESRFAVLGADRTAQLFARATLWEEKLQEIAKAFRIALHSLPAAKSAPPKLILAAMMKHTTSTTNRWLAERLHMGKASSIGALVRQFRLKGGPQTKEFKAVLSRFMT